MVEMRFENGMMRYLAGFTMPVCVDDCQILLCGHPS